METKKITQKGKNERVGCVFDKLLKSNYHLTYLVLFKNNQFSGVLSFFFWKKLTYNKRRIMLINKIFKLHTLNKTIYYNTMIAKG